MKKIGVVVHELARTGSPIVGLSIAQFLHDRGHHVHVFAKVGGALEEKDIFRSNRGLPLTITETGHTCRPKITRFRARSRARDVLKTHQLDMLYVNSFAAAEWCLAANDLDIPVFFHVHELKPAVVELRKAGMFSQRYRPKIKGLISVSQDSHNIACKTLSYRSDAPAMILTSFTNLDQLKENAKKTPPPAKTATGKQLDWRNINTTPLICMCGSAVQAKGVDLFFKVASLCPASNFIWVGSFDKADEPANPIFEKFHEDKLENLYITGSIENPASVFSHSDVLLFTTRQDSNPLVIIEAISLRLPTICFIKALGCPEILEKFGIALPGNPNVRAILKTLSNQPLLKRQREFLSLRNTQSEFREKISHQKKLETLYAFLDKNLGMNK